MSSLARRLDRAGLAIIAAMGLGGCFGSRTPLVPANESLKLFGERGAATRVEFGRMVGPPENVTFTWAGDSYRIADPREPRAQATYRIAPFQQNYLITQRFDHGVAVYGLARREGDRLWTYSPACQDLSDADRGALGLTLQADGMCWVTTPAQLKNAMRRASVRLLQPDGYFELKR
ncbi:MAG TPA: hypothetical protein VG983_07660 [Caulobacterales bacterium]|nr:hypothetical protein [Caulobacterales bacterium]